MKFLFSLAPPVICLANQAGVVQEFRRAANHGDTKSRSFLFSASPRVSVVQALFGFGLSELGCFAVNKTGWTRVEFEKETIKMASFEIVSDITEIEVIAVGNSIRDLPRLRKLYGEGRWR